MGHRRKPVGDDQHRLVPEGLVHGVLDLPLGFGVQGGGGLVQDDQARPPDQCPGNGDSLPLAAAEPGPGVADLGVYPLLQALHKVPQPGIPERLLHLGVGGVQFAVADILGDGPPEQVGLLRHHGDILPQFLQGSLSYRTAQHPQVSLIALVQSADQPEEGGFAAAAGADDPHVLPRLHVKLHPLEHRLSREIGETQALHGHGLPAGFLDRGGGGGLRFFLG